MQIKINQGAIKQSKGLETPQMPINWGLAAETKAQPPMESSAVVKRNSRDLQLHTCGPPGCSQMKSVRQTKCL